MRINPMITRFVTAILLTFSAFASQASGPGSSWSKIEGVILWNLHGSGSSPASTTFEGDGKDDSFFKYCDGKNKIYIYELDSNGYICQSGNSEEYYGFHVKGVSVKLDGIYTISKYPIEQKKWKFESLGNTEAATARETAKKYSTKIDRGGDAYDNKSALGLHNKYEGKISVGMKEVLIVPTKYSYWQTSNEDLASAVVVMESGSYRVIGHIDGCLERLADIDGDGVPEVMTKTCASGGWLHVNYWRVYPEVKLLARYSY